MVEDLSNEEILQVLKTNFLGRLGLHDGDKTYVIPTNYVYDGKFILCHAVEGAKIKIMRQYPSVCFEVEEIKSFTNWRSILAQGWYQELTEERDRYNAMKSCVDHGLHIKVPHNALESRAALADTGMSRTERPVIYRIVITELSGKCEVE
jgi:uncharacterized protein